MSYKSVLILIFSIFILSACSLKEQIKVTKQINSIALDKNIYIAGVPKTVKSPVSINLGLGGYVSKHVGISVGGSVRPDIKNSDALNLQKAMANYNIDLASLIKDRFSTQMRNDNFFKNKFVPFGANHTIYLNVKKYDMDSSLVNSKAEPKFYLQMSVRNQNDDIIYENTEVSSFESTFSVQEIYSNPQLLIKTINMSLDDVSLKLIKELKRN